MHKKGDFLQTINQGIIHILLTGVVIIFLKCRHCFNFVRPQQLLPQFYCNTLYAALPVYDKTGAL